MKKDNSILSLNEASDSKKKSYDSRRSNSSKRLQSLKKQYCKSSKDLNKIQGGVLEGRRESPYRNQNQFKLF
jgi:hypothetical protein